MAIISRVIVILLIVWQASVCLCQAEEYYVHFTDGSDANPGTYAQPLKHHPWMGDYDPSGDAPSTLSPGDIIYMARGEQWISSKEDRHLIEIQDSGSEDGGYIKTTSYGSGDAPLLKRAVSGMDVINGFGDVAYVWFDSLHLQHSSSTAEEDGNGIAISGDSDNQISPHHIQITNCEIDQIPYVAIKIENSHHVVVGDLNALTTAIESDYSNHIHDFGYAGIALTGTDFTTKQSHYHIYHNYIHDSDPDGYSESKTAYGITTSKANEAAGFPYLVYVRYNRVENIHSWVGIGTDGAFHWYCQYNDVRNCHQSVSVAAEHDNEFGAADPTGPHYITNNTFINDADFSPVNFQDNPKPFAGLHGEDSDTMLQDVTFRDNVISHQQPPTFTTQKDGLSVRYIKGLLLQGNRIFNNSTGNDASTALRFSGEEDGSIENLIMVRNEIYGWSGIGVGIYTPAMRGTFILYNNVLSTSKWPIYLSSGVLDTDADIRNNTLVVNSGQEDEAVCFYSRASLADGVSFSLINNIFSLTSSFGGMYVDWENSEMMQGTIEFKSNLYYGSDKVQPFRVAGESQPSTWDVFHTDFDPEGVNADPMFFDATGDNYYLDEDSPCIDAGTNVYEPEDGALDIGAFEFSSEDLDGDGMSNAWEQEYGLDEMDASDAEEDLDTPAADGLSNLEEFVWGTDPTKADTDSDGMTDGWEALYGLDPSDPEDAGSDQDEDGLSNIKEHDQGTNPLVSDSDQDGMTDGWESFLGFNPLSSADGGGDQDGDGLSNRKEYEHNTNPYNEKDPCIAVLYIPLDDSQVDLTEQVVLMTTPYTGVAEHLSTQWELVQEQEGLIVFDVTTSSPLEFITIPDLVLEANQSYRWRARYTDEKSIGELWSEQQLFSTNGYDPFYGESVLLDQKVEDDTVDLDIDGDLDRFDETYLAVTDPEIDQMIAIKAGSGIDSIDKMRIVDVAAIPGEENSYLAYGLVQFKMKVSTEDPVFAEFFFSQNISSSASVYLWDTVNGWQNYTADGNAIIDDPLHAVVGYVDGGVGDADGVVNGVIIASFGVNETAQYTSPQSTSTTIENNACFIGSLGKDFVWP